MIAARTSPALRNFDKSKINKDFVNTLASLCELEDGPTIGIRRLAEAGIALVYVEQLPEMYLDSAVMTTKEGNPVIGLTLRNDCLDSFWFSIFHSVAHIWKHLSEVHYFLATIYLLPQNALN